MSNNFKYLNFLKRCGITPDIGEQICRLLTKSTLEKLINLGDIRLVKPILNKANYMEKGINDENINLLLRDSNVITKLMSIYCK